MEPISRAHGDDLERSQLVTLPLGLQNKRDHIFEIAARTLAEEESLDDFRFIGFLEEAGRALLTRRSRRRGSSCTDSCRSIVL